MQRQKMLNPLLKASWVFGALFLVGCGGSQESETPGETYSVFDGDEIVSLSSKIVPCSYVGFNQQVIVKGCYAAQDSETRYQTYSDIDGLDLSWGTQYLVHLEYWKSADEIADGPQRITKVKEILNQQEDPAGTQYEYLAVNTAFVFGGNQRFLNQTWQCGLSEGCDWIINSGSFLIDLMFEKQTDGSMLLIEAESVSSER